MSNCLRSLRDADQVYHIQDPGILICDLVDVLHCGPSLDGQGRKQASEGYHNKDQVPRQLRVLPCALKTLTGTDRGDYFD